VTVVVWDGRTLAADRMASSNYIKVSAVTKIAAINGCLVGTSGNSSFAEEWRRWFARGGRPEEFTDLMRDQDEFTNALVITPAREILLYQRGPYPVLHHNDKHAIGSGAEVALAVMHMGGDARKAVEVASAICVGVGNGLDTLTLEECRRVRTPDKSPRIQLPAEAPVL
jgi:hypothetical protein